MSEAREYAVPVEVAALSEAATTRTLRPDAATRARIARRLGVEAVETLEADLTLRLEGRVVRVTGGVRAQLRRTCVATLAPVREDIDARVDVALAPAGAADGPDPEDAGDPLAGPDADVYEDGIVDVGDLVVQDVALAMAAYPRAPDAPAVRDDVESSASPFAGLYALVDGRARDGR